MARSPGVLSIAGYPRPRLRDWEAQGVWPQACRLFLAELDAQGHLDWAETSADGSLVPAKKGGLCRKDRTGQGYEVDLVHLGARCTGGSGGLDKTNQIHFFRESRQWCHLRSTQA
jgi:hypothetical protein